MSRHHFNLAREAWALAYLPTPKAQGVRRYGKSDMDGGLSWVVFSGCTLADVEAWLVANRWESRDVRGSHDCTGEYFARSPWVRAFGRSSFLVTLSWGYDV